MRLNPQQAVIVDHPHGESALVMAGAGSGKTTVIAHRAINLARAMPPGKLLQMLTFSNKAATEMKERVRRLGTPDDLELIRVDTFHSFGLKLIKADPELFNMEEGFTLLSENDIKRSIRQRAKALGLPKELAQEDRKRLDPMAWLSTWSLAKQAGFHVRNPENKATLCERLIKAHQLGAGEIELAWETLQGYESEKSLANSLDFDDLLFQPLLRLAQDEIYRQRIQSGIGHMVVDESQDTNRIQYEMVRRIALGYCGVTCVGDDDQSIYGWRGAEVSNLFRFVKQFAAAELRLEQNYRSTQSIVSTASSLIANNTKRLDKRPFSEGEVGRAPALVCTEDSRAMADEIASQVADAIAAGAPPKEIAVLYRTNRMAMLIEQAMRKARIPYHVVGGMSLFDRAEVSAVCCALRLASNPRDTYALKALTPMIDGFGQASSYALADAMEFDPALTLNNLPDSIGAVPARSLAAIKEFISELQHSALLAESAAEFVQWAIEGPMALLDREKDQQLRSKRQQHLEALANDIDAEVSERRAQTPRTTWRDVLGEVAIRDLRQSEAAAGQVTLSTAHRSKGLEWDIIHIAGFSEGLMPLDSRADLDDGEAGYAHLEEERRVAYVAVTRARKQVTLHHAARYFFPGMNQAETRAVSPFAKELGIHIPHLNFSMEDGMADSGLFEEFSSMVAGNATNLRLS